LPLLLMMVVERTGGLAGLAVADDQLALAAPIGIMLSMAFSPVAMGSRTGWRSMTPGARRSRAMNWSVVIGPLSSMGGRENPRPSDHGVTYRTLMMRPVRFTSSPL